jgi:hypothetical protein
MYPEYDFEMVKRAYAEMARRAQEKDAVRRPHRQPAPANGEHSHVEAANQLDSPQ